MAGALVQWVKLPAWKVGHRGYEPHSVLPVSKKQNVSSPLTRKDSILWGASVSERWRAQPQTARARISNPVSGGSVISFISPSSGNSHSLYVHKGGLINPIHSFILFYFQLRMRYRALQIPETVLIGNGEDNNICINSSFY